MQSDYRDDQPLDLAIATRLRSARSGRTATSEGSEVPPVSSESAVQGRGFGSGFVGRAGRRVMRGPLTRLRSFLTAPLDEHVIALTSRLDREFAIAALDRRQSEIATLSLSAEVVRLREEIISLRAELTSASPAPMESAREV